MHPPRLMAALALLLPTAAAWAAQPKQPVTDLDQKAFFKPELYIASSQASLQDIQSRLPNQGAWNAFLQARAAAGQSVNVFIDPRSGAAVNIVGAFPLIPGTGAGNLALCAAIPNTTFYERGLLHPFIDYDRPPAHLRRIDDEMDTEGYVHLRDEPGLGQDIDHAYIDDHLVES